MKILIDENKYLTFVCIDAELDGGIEVETPKNVDTFIDMFEAYKYENGRLILDKDKLEILNDERVANDLRHKREKACFPYVNRGEMWYSRLSSKQKKDLCAWYQAWLDVTDTKVIPEKPEWLM